MSKPVSATISLRTIADSPLLPGEESEKTMLTPEEDRKKREIFDAMSPRRQERILKKGYDTWDPFQIPKEPPALLRKEQKEKQQALQLFREYLAAGSPSGKSTEYLTGIMEMCEGLVGGSDRFRGMYDLACWYEKRGEE